MAVHVFHSLCGPGTSSLSTWVCLLTESEFGWTQSLLMLGFGPKESGVRRSLWLCFSLRRACPDLPWEGAYLQMRAWKASDKQMHHRVGEPCETAEGS